MVDKFKSKFEKKVAEQLQEKGVKYEYEAESFDFTKVHRYTPDFRLGKKLYIETKGRFTSSDRSKHLSVKAQHPSVDIRFVFQRACNTLSKRSKTTYAEWCDKHGFRWAEGEVPKEWQEEALSLQRGAKKTRTPKQSGRGRSKKRLPKTTSQQQTEA